MAEMERILVVDDEAGICRMVIRILKGLTRTVDAVATAEAALPRITNNAYDLYILDKNLPGMSGIELAAAIRATDRSAGILIFTGFASRESALEALHVGVDGYVEKPVMRVALLERADEALAAARRRRRLSRRIRSARAAARDALGQRDRSRPSRILTAYADAAFGEQLTAALVQSGHRADCVTSVDGVMAELEANPPDVLITDAALLVDLTTALKGAVAKRPHLAVIVTGTPPSFQQIQALIASGVKAVVETPLNGGHVSDELSRLLGAPC